jgi:hypothetical protein
MARLCRSHHLDHRMAVRCRPYSCGWWCALWRSRKTRPDCDNHSNPDHSSHRHPQFIGLPTALERTSPAHLRTVVEPVGVVEAFFTAINHHDWRMVWQLGGKNLGTGIYSTSSGMILGYRCTDRDVLNGPPRRAGRSCRARFSRTKPTAPHTPCSATHSVMKCAAVRSYLATSHA